MIANEDETSNVCLVLVSLCGWRYNVSNRFCIVLMSKQKFYTLMHIENSYVFAYIYYPLEYTVLL